MPTHIYRITIAIDEEQAHQFIILLVTLMLVGIPAAITVAFVVGYVIAGQVLAPVNLMAAKAGEITAEGLAERLPVNNPDDEFGRLATVFNQTFARLEDAFDRMRRFTSDASHELRTPLTVIRSVGEVGLQKDNDVHALREVIASMLEETDRLTRLVDSLLTLSRERGSGTVRAQMDGSQ
jgi:signal transduction histidine kinase